MWLSTEQPVLEAAAQRPHKTPAQTYGEWAGPVGDESAESTESQPMNVSPLLLLSAFPTISDSAYASLLENTSHPSILFWTQT